MKVILVGVLAALALTGCVPDDDDHDRKKYPPGYGVTPIPRPTFTKAKAPGYRPVPAPPRKVK